MDPPIGHTSSSSGDILIIGAGVTGLLIGHGLRKNGIPFRIFDALPPPQSEPRREWSMGIHWSLPMLQTLLSDSLLGRLSQTYTDPHNEPPETDRYRIYHGGTGEVIKEIPLPRTIRVSRGKMQRLLLEEMPVEFNHRLSTIAYGAQDSGIVAHFHNGLTVPGAMVLGADGPHSRVRELLLGSESAKCTTMGLVELGAIVSYGDAERARTVRSSFETFAATAVHPTGVLNFVTMQNVPSPTDPSTWSFQIFLSFDGQRDPTLDNAARLALMKSRAEVLAEPFRSAVLWIPEGTPVHLHNHSYWSSKIWANHGGRVTLAGDAAHPMPPNRGQGLNHAICDAAQLVKAISASSPKATINGSTKEPTSDAPHLVDGKATAQDSAQEGGLEAAITAYDAEVVRRGAEEVDASCRQAAAMLDWGTFMESPMMKFSLGKIEKV